MNGWVGSFLSYAALPALITAAACMTFDVARRCDTQWTLLISSTIFMRRVRNQQASESGTAPTDSAGLPGRGEPADCTVEAPPTPQTPASVGSPPPTPALAGLDMAALGLAAADSPDRRHPLRQRSGVGPGDEASTPARITPPPVSLSQTSMGAGGVHPPCPRTYRASTPQCPVGDGPAPATSPTGLHRKGA